MEQNVRCEEIKDLNSIEFVTDEKTNKIYNKNGENNEREREANSRKDKEETEYGESPIRTERDNARRNADERDSNGQRSNRDTAGNNEEIGVLLRDDEHDPDSGNNRAKVSGKESSGHESSGAGRKDTTGDNTNGMVPTSTDERSGSGINYDLRTKANIKLTKAQRKHINERAKEILASKESDFSEEEKDILRQYTGEGVLSEFIGRQPMSDNKHYVNF